MAYVVARSGGRFEVRESRTTPVGPRARTLASFRVFDARVLARVAERAERPVDAAALARSARRAGALVADRDADREARALLGRLRAGGRLSPGLAVALAHALGRPPAVPDAVVGAAEWIGASADARGAALRDLLLLADRLPARPRAASQFPRLVSRP